MDYLYDYDYMDYDYEDGEQILEQHVKSFSEVWVNCVYPSFHEAKAYIGIFLIWILICRIGCQLVTNYILAKHIIATICGWFTLKLTLGTSLTHFVAFSIFTYIVLYGLFYFKVRHFGYILTFTCIATLIVLELIETNNKAWPQIRGVQMLVAMKSISLAFDVELKKIDDLPNIIQFSGYILCPSNCIMGPWISYDEYMTNLYDRKLGYRKTIIYMIVNTILAIAFLLLSNCLVSMLFSNSSWKWLQAYRDALAFRCSHYFISYLSQATMVTAGFQSLPDKSFNIFGYSVTKPWTIEFPRSLVQVVISWNIPMHRWLKTYVFRVLNPQGTALAIFATYLISSLLHGLNFQLAAILLSLGFYTYVEYGLRQKLSVIYSACILAANCKNCEHTHKSKNPIVVFVNIVFGLLSVFHLAYLGVMFEASDTIQEQGYSSYHVLNKWQNLDFLSHWIVLFCYIFYLLI